RNQRSAPGLIEALNGLYTATAHPFLLDGLDYHRVEMGDKPRAPLCDRTLARADLQLWMLPESDTDTPIAKVEARSFSARATAREIARLIGEGQRGRITIGERPLAPTHLAV